MRLANRDFDVVAGPASPRPTPVRRPDAEKAELRPQKTQVLGQDVINATETIRAATNVKVYKMVIMDQGHGVHLPGIVATEDGVEHWLPDKYRTVFQAKAAIRAMERRDNGRKSARPKSRHRQTPEPI